MTQERQVRPILDVARSLELDPAQLIPYGRDKAKIALDALEPAGRPGGWSSSRRSRPTPPGEGKTTTSIGLAQGLARHRRSACALALREPSLGPVLRHEGRRHRRRRVAGRAGGRHQPPLHRRLPRDHRRAHNLLAAMLDNHLHHGNALGIDPRRVALAPRAST